MSTGIDVSNTKYEVFLLVVHLTRTDCYLHTDCCLPAQDYEIMGELEYSSSKTTALVKFQAHKFPYTR